MSDTPLPAFASSYLALFDDTWSDDTPAGEVRFILLDSETTGLDPRKDRLITIGAVSVMDDQILLDDSFEAMLQVEYNSSAVTVHGITRDQARDGMEEPEAITAFLDYLKDGVIVGHHIGHDVETFNAAYERHFGFTLRNRAIDTMELTLNLERDGAFRDQGEIRGFSLDALCDLFGVEPHDRHTAAGDAFITAQVFLKLLRLAKRFDRTTLGQLSEPYVPDEQPAG